MLDKATLITDIKAIFDYESEQEESPEASRQRVAQELADVIDRFVKTGTVTVNTTGTASAQHGTGNIT